MYTLNLSLHVRLFVRQKKSGSHCILCSTKAALINIFINNTSKDVQEKGAVHSDECTDLSTDSTNPLHLFCVFTSSSYLYWFWCQQPHWFLFLLSPIWTWAVAYIQYSKQTAEPTVDSGTFRTKYFSCKLVMRINRATILFYANECECKFPMLHFLRMCIKKLFHPGNHQICNNTVCQPQVYTVLIY